MKTFIVTCHQFHAFYKSPSVSFNNSWFLFHSSEQSKGVGFHKVPFCVSSLLLPALPIYKHYENKFLLSERAPKGFKRELKKWSSRYSKACQMETMKLEWDAI